MRLRLVVKRYSLPDTPVAWALDTSNNPTIAQLLEQVNEILPLESGGDWGLEDYCVEIKGKGTNFECLHFQYVMNILHEDDEVIIRPLLALDLKQRTVSGRRQISSSGLHLFDGTVFGRPRPRSNDDRPALEIPPRKRRRITFNEDQWSNSIEEALPITNDDAGNRQLVLRANFEDVDDSGDDESEDDEDFQPEEDEEDEEVGDLSDDEVKGLLEDASEMNGNPDGDNVMDELSDDETRDRIRELQEAFPTAPTPVCRRIILSSDGNLKAAWDALKQAFSPAKSKKEFLKASPQVNSLTVQKIRKKKAPATSKSPLVSAIPDENEQDSSEDDEEMSEGDDLAEYYNQHGLPAGSISTTASAENKKLKKFSDSPQSGAVSGSKSTSLPSVTKSKSPLKKKVKIQPRADKPSNMQLDSDSSGTSSEGSSDDSESEHDSDKDSSSESGSDSDSDNSSSSESDSESENESESGSDQDSDSDSDSGSNSNFRGHTINGSHKSKRPSSSKNSSSDSSSNDSGSEPNEKSSKLVDQGKKANASKTAPNTSSPTPIAVLATVALAVNSQTISAPKSDSKTTVPPGSGSQATKTRNQRRRLANEYKRLLSKGILPAGTTIEDFKANKGGLHNSDKTSEAQTINMISERNESSAAVLDAEFKARRAQLLASLASGGVDMSNEKPSNVEAESNNKASQVARPVTPATGTSAAGTPDVTSATSTPSARMRLNLGAAGRMVFAALGVRPPKTKEDQEKVRKELMKDIRPVPIKSPSATIAPTVFREQDGDPETWRQKINLRAVECCHDGIVLSEPPFPFVQRWDPQQRGEYGTWEKTKRKRSYGDQAQYDDHEGHSAKKHKNRRQELGGEYESSPINYENGIGESGLAVSLNANNVLSDGAGGKANDQLMHDAQEATIADMQPDGDDLPELQEDITSLAVLSQGEVKSGIIIAFKQLTMSDATNWQPEISKHRTAKVDKVDDYGQIEMYLAYRDRDFQYFDDDGKRILGKFDMPVDDDDREDYDDGYRSLAFHELLDPRIVELAAESDAQPVETVNKENHSTDQSAVFDSENLVSQSEISHGLEVEKEKFADATELHSHTDTSETRDPVTENNRGNSQVADGDEITKERRSSDDSVQGGELIENAIDTDDQFVSADARAEISVLIKDAGFRSELPSSVVRGLAKKPVSSEDWSATSLEDSPEEFNSPILKVIVDHESSSFAQDIPSSPPVPADESPLLDHSQQSAKNSVDAAIETEGLVTGETVQYPKLSLPSSLASEVADYGRQPDYPTPGDDTLNRFEVDNITLGEGRLKSVQPDVSQLDNGIFTCDDDDYQLPPSSIRHSLMSNSNSQDDLSDGLDAIFSGAAKHEVNQLTSPNGKVYPSTAPAPQRLEWPYLIDAVVDEDDQDSYEREMAFIDANIEGEENEDPCQIMPKASISQASDDMFLKEESSFQASKVLRKTNRKGKAHENKSGSQFSLPAGSQLVDLTLSSDNPDYTSHEIRETNDLMEHLFGAPDDLPQGPGWVTKKQQQSQTKSKRQSSASQRLSASQPQPVPKTKSLRRKTVARF